MRNPIAVLLAALLLLSLCACSITPTPTARPTSSATTAAVDPPTDAPTQQPATATPTPPDKEEEYLARMTAALAEAVPERSVSVVRCVTGGVTLTSSFTYTAADDRTAYTRQRLGELTLEGGGMIVTEEGDFKGRAASPEEGIALSDLSLSLSYFSALSFDDETPGQLTAEAALHDNAVTSVFGRAPTGGTDFHLRIVMRDDRVVQLCLTYRTTDASVTVQSDFTY